MTHKVIGCLSGQIRTNGIVVIKVAIYDRVNVIVMVMEGLVASLGEVVYSEANVTECFDELVGLSAFAP